MCTKIERIFLSIGAPDRYTKNGARSVIFIQKLSIEKENQSFDIFEKEVKEK